MDSADSSRREELRQFLQLELEALRVDPDFRIRWLLEQLGNYVDRWVDRRSPSSGPDDLFTMIEVATEVMSDELNARDGESNRDWTNFTEALTDVPHANPQSGEGLRESFRKVRAAIINVFG